MRHRAVHVFPAAPFTRARSHRCDESGSRRDPIRDALLLPCEALRDHSGADEPRAVHSMTLRTASPTAVRLACRTGELTRQTSGLADGFAQANLVVLPQ